jgi:hypothetical protein
MNIIQALQKHESSCMRVVSRDIVISTPNLRNAIGRDCRTRACTCCAVGGWGIGGQRRPCWLGVGLCSISVVQRAPEGLMECLVQSPHLRRPNARACKQLINVRLHQSASGMFSISRQAPCPATLSRHLIRSCLPMSPWLDDNFV